jgi:hypothetical protein
MTVVPAARKTAVFPLLPLPKTKSSTVADGSGPAARRQMRRVSGLAKVRGGR